MERAQLVKEYCKANPMPVQDLCPEVNQYFKTAKGYEIWNSRTFVRETVDFNPGYWNVCRDRGISNPTTPRKEYEGFYVRYIEELDALEMARVWLKGNRGQNGEEKYWSYRHNFYYSYSEDRFFLFHNDSNAYLYDGTVQTGSKYYSKFVIDALSEWMGRSLTCGANYTELKKFTPRVRFNSETTYWGWSRSSGYAPQVWEYREWYKRDFFDRKISEKAKNILAYELDDIEFTRQTNRTKAILFQKLDDNYAVLRCYDYPHTWSTTERRYVSTNDNGTEVARLFVPSKGKPTMMAKEGDTWKVKASTPWRAKDSAEIINYEEMENYPRLKYILPCINKSDCSIQSFVNILRHPIVEQLYKAGYPETAKALCRDDTIAANLREVFGVEKEKKLPMFKLLGVNKFVLNAAEKRNSPLSVISEIKYFVGDFDATKINEETCELLAGYIEGVNNWTINNIREIVDYERWNYWRRDCGDPLTDEQRKWVIRLLKMEKKQPGCVSLFRDTLDVYRRVNNKPDIDLYGCHNHSEISRLHDAIINLQIQEEADRRAAYDERERRRMEDLKKTFEKLQEDRISKFEFENDEYCIRVPHELTEITKEGVCLHHCVGGYVDRHANGNTNIIFLRRKGAEDTPFYTIEIDNGNNVVQIHGYGNRWLGNNPEVVPFVYTYLNKIGAKYNKQLLLNKGTGYCASSDNLDDSYLKNIA